MRVRAKVVAKGKVQSAGYRDEVEEVALDLGIKGFVRNMEEKDRVEIVCEADERIIDKFLKKIKIKNELIDVKKLTVKKTKPTGEFKTFKIIRKNKDSEIAERMDEAVKHLKGVKKGMYEVRDEVKGSRKDIKGVGDEVKEFRLETKENFQTMKNDYGKISLYMERIIESTEKDRKDFRDAIKELARAIVESKK